MSRETDVFSALEDATELIRSFAEYWLSMTPVDLIPERTSFRPEDVPHIIPYLAIHEILSEDFIKLRLAGTVIVDDYGIEVTGRNYLDFVAPRRRPKASKAIHLICEQPSAMLVQLRSSTASDKILTRESIGFPVRNDDGQANLVYFCSSPAQERETFFDEPDEMKLMNVTDRRFIDIGAGIPDFQD